MTKHEPVAYTINIACEVAGCGRTKLYEAIGNGSLRSKKLGARTLILSDDLRSWLGKLPDGAGPFHKT